MNKKNVFLSSILAVIMMLSFSSCSKDGEQGPAGPQGEQGIQGVQGIPGKDGAVILNGNGVPATTLGNIGDMYLDKTASNLYGPKTSSGWGTPLNLKGATGATGATGSTGATGQSGAAGSKILSGTANPASSAGAVGDYYLNKTTGDFFGPKTSLGWGTPINLKGTANVVATKWIDYNWNVANTVTRKSMDYTIPGPVLSAVGYSSLINFSNAGGVILIYGKNWGSNSLLLFDYEYRNGRYKASPNTNGNKIYLYLESINGNPLQETEYSSARGNQFRYVLIPPGVQLSGAVNKDNLPININWNEISYHQMSKILNIND